MARCETCGNDYDKAMRIVIDGHEHVIDCCADQMGMESAHDRA